MCSRCRSAVMDKLQQQMMSNIDKVSPESLIQSWFSFDPKLADRMQDMFVTMTGLGALGAAATRRNNDGRPRRWRESRRASQASSQLRPPGLALLLAEARGILEFNASLLLSPLLMRAPRGDGHPVLALPGFLASDLSMVPLRRYLDRARLRRPGLAHGPQHRRHREDARRAARPARRNPYDQRPQGLARRLEPRRRLCPRPRAAGAGDGAQRDHARRAPLPTTSAPPTRRGSTRRCRARASATIRSSNRPSPATCRFPPPRSIRGPTAS